MIDYIRYALLVMGAIPLVLYPMAAVASLMGLACNSTFYVPVIYRIIDRFFLWGTLIYPLIYAVCYWVIGLLGYWVSGYSEEHGLVFAFIPVVFLILLWLSFCYLGASQKARLRNDNEKLSSS